MIYLVVYNDCYGNGDNDSYEGYVKSKADFKKWLKKHNLERIGEAGHVEDEYFEIADKAYRAHPNNPDKQEEKIIKLLKEKGLEEYLADEIIDQISASIEGEEEFDLIEVDKL
jgi:hypothetical protein